MAETVILVSRLQEFNSDVLAKYLWEENQFRYDRRKESRFRFRDDLKALGDEIGKLEDFLYPTLHIAEECGAARNVYEAIFRMCSNVCKTIFRASWMQGSKIKKLNDRITEIQRHWLCPPYTESASVNAPAGSDHSNDRRDTICAVHLKEVYNALPDVLKPCVDYFYVFPKIIVTESENCGNLIHRETHAIVCEECGNLIYSIECEKLIYMWIAQGFVAGALYNVGRLYIKEFIDRGLIEASQVGGDGLAERVKFPSLLHDLAVSEYVTQTEPAERLKTSPAIDCPLRTLLLSHNSYITATSKLSIFNYMVHLTVLDLSDTDIGSLPESIGKLKHLKFLNLSATRILELPEDLNGLRRLQFLDVSSCPNLSKLHSGIGKHKFMLYLNVKECPELERLPVGISELHHLHTLKVTLFDAIDADANATLSDAPANSNAEAKDLQLRNIKGLKLLRHLSLEIKNFTGPSLEQCIFMKKLCTLSIVNHEENPFHIAKVAEVMECLETVSLSRCVVPEWTFGLQNLMDLRLEFDDRDKDDYRGLEKTPSLKKLHLLLNDKCIEFPKEFGERGAFPKLEEFIVERFSRLEKFPPVISTAMPMLKYFRIRWCDNFRNMVQGIEDLSSLQELEFLVKRNIQRANELWTGQWLQSLKDRQIKIIVEPEDQPAIDAIYGARRSTCNCYQ